PVTLIVTYILSLHDALPIFVSAARITSIVSSTSTTLDFLVFDGFLCTRGISVAVPIVPSPTHMYWVWPIFPTTPATLSSSPTTRSEEHTSELQSRSDLVCRL